MGVEILPDRRVSAPTSTVDREKAGGQCDEASTKRLLRRIDLRLVPILSALYLLCFLCRQNIANAKTYHLKDHLHLSQKDYQLALTVFFFTYSLFDIPANILLKKLRPSVWLPLITFLSGSVTIGMGFAKSAQTLIIARLFLGMTECGLFPGVAYCITMWYRRSEAQFRQALFFCAASMAGAFAGLLAVPLSKLDGVGGLEGFRWIFIIEGLLTVIVATSSFFLVLDFPDTASFLSDSERTALLDRLEVDELGEDDSLLTASERSEIHLAAAATVPRCTIFKTVFSDWHIYAHILVFLGISVPLYSISLCLPSIVQTLGYSATSANFLTVPIYMMSCILSLLVAFISDHFNTRFLPLIASFATMFSGFLIATLSTRPAISYFAVFLAACGVYPAFPGMITWASNNVAPSSSRAVSMAFHIGMGSFGGAMGPNFYRPADAPRYRLGHGMNLLFVTMGGASATLVWWSYKRENKRREEICRELERTGGGGAAVAAVGENGNREEEEEEKEEVIRHAFLAQKEKTLALEGDRSVWFRYVL